jgi:hypothetical protein
MADAHAIPEPDRKGLRDFGLVTGAIFAGLFGVLFPWLRGHATPWWPWVIAAVLIGMALVVPDWLRLVYRWWMKLGLLLGKITTPIILGIVFVVAILPTALILKLRGRDPMARRFDAAASTYRVESRQPDKQGMERPF